MLGTYCTIWSQQNPISSLGKIVVGFLCLNVLPPSVEYAAVQFAVTKTTPPPVAPLGSTAPLLLAWPFAPPEMSPNPLLTLNTTAGGSPNGAGCTCVFVGVGVPGTTGAVGTGGPPGLTSGPKSSG